MLHLSRKRPIGIVGLSIFFLLGALISFTAGLALLFPRSVAGPIWQLNPHGYEGLLRLGFWGPTLLFTASVSCATAAFGLWRRKRWGHVIAVLLISINLFSDVVNWVLGTEPKAIVGVPIALLLLVYLLIRPVRTYFSST